VRTPGHQIVLIDGGSSPQRLEQELGHWLPFWRRDIDLIIRAGGQEDTLTSLAEVVRRRKVTLVMDSGLGGPSASYTRWMRALADKRARYVTAEAGR
jgi:hypothetical protein